MGEPRIDWDLALGNQHYRGAAFGWWLLLLLGCMNLFRGSVHLFTDDGGASRIAGIDLSQNGAVILTLFAGMGLNQLLLAAIDFTVALRFRALAPVLLAYHLVQAVGTGVIVWGWRELPLDAPGKFGPLVLAPLIALALWSSVRPADARQSRDPTPHGRPTPRRSARATRPGARDTGARRPA